ncbi:MAG: hypothetical protein JW719_00495, partial [Pirellulales bacterium]|nr:hypothetical protein [Pirellulales bacterium]
MIGRWFFSLLILAALAVPARADEPARPVEPAAGRNVDDEYELQRMLVDTLDQVERNYVQGIS